MRVLWWLLDAFLYFLSLAFSLQVAEAILEWSVGCAEEVEEDGQTPSPAELCSTADAEGKTAFVFAKENVRLRYKCYLPLSPLDVCTARVTVAWAVQIQRLFVIIDGVQRRLAGRCLVKRIVILRTEV